MFHNFKTTREDGFRQKLNKLWENAARELKMVIKNVVKQNVKKNKVLQPNSTSETL